jgi:putative endonuclease
MYYVYIVRCADGTLYTGIATELARRLKEHNSGHLGAKYTRSRRPVVLAYKAPFADRAEASSEEYRIKQLPRAGKLALIKHSKKV